MHRNRRAGPWLGLWLLALTLLGCSYRFVGYAATHEGGKPRRIAVVTLENDSYEPGIELMVSEALRREILSRGGFALVEPGAAVRSHGLARGDRLDLSDSDRIGPMSLNVD